MKYFFYVFLLGFFIYSCSSTRERTMEPEANFTGNDTVRIANDSLEYEIIIIDPGYSYFLNTIARPEGYYSQSYPENKNQFLVTDYNQRVRQPFRYNPNIYEHDRN